MASVTDSISGGKKMGERFFSKEDHSRVVDGHANKAAFREFKVLYILKFNLCMM